MIGEREYKNPETDYGTLVMRSYDIDGNEIKAFYDSSDNLVFVLDNTINVRKPNVLLVINPDGDKKWDEILSNDYDVDLETIRPKQDNKYQKLDIEYSGLNVYENLIKAYDAGRGLDEELNQLNILRDSAARHSAMMRLNAANEIISKTNTTIVKTKETIIRLQERVKTLRAKLSATKKQIGKVSTKQSAAQVLKIESQIEATNDKLKRAKKRLESAQKRLEMATVDAELAGDLLNQPSSEIKPVAKNKPIAVAPKYPVQTISESEDDNSDEESDDDDDDVADDDYDFEEITDNENEDVKPLFNQDPQIMNEDIAFKPISFENLTVPEPVSEPEPAPMVTNVLQPAPVEDDNKTVPEENSEKPMLDSLTNAVPVPDFYDDLKTEDSVEEEPVAERPVLDTMTSVEEHKEEPVVSTTETEVFVQPETPNIIEPPVPNNVPVTQNEVVVEEKRHKPTFMYYLLLIILIVLSVFTLWLYQKNVNNTVPVLTTRVENVTPESKPSVLKKQSKPAVKEAVKEEQNDIDTVFLDEEKTDNVVETETPVVETSETEVMPDVEPEYTEPVQTEEVVMVENSAPVVMDAVPARVMPSVQSEEPVVVPSEEEILANKPVYEPGAKHEEMFIAEGVEPEYESDDDVYYDEEYDDEEYWDDSEGPFYDEEYDEEEAQYQAEQNEAYYEE